MPAGQGLSMAVKADSLQDLYATVAPQNFGPGWNKPTPSLWPQPLKHYVPAHWAYRDGHDALERAGRLIGTELAERRNLIMANPLEGNTYNTSATLITAYQMLLPGEHARSHRHMPNALRLIVEADEGAYTIVNGEKIMMLPGDVVLTPVVDVARSRQFWENPGLLDRLPRRADGPVARADVLRRSPEGVRGRCRAVERLPAALHVALDRGAPQRGEGRPAGPPRPSGHPRHAVAEDDPPAHERARRRIENHALPDDGVQHLQRRVGHAAKPRSTAPRSRWAPGDVFVAPPWRSHVHEPETDAVLFRVTDEAALDLLGFLREAN